MGNLICLVVITLRGAVAGGVSLMMVEIVQVDGFRRVQTLYKIGLMEQYSSEILFDDMLVQEGNILGLEPGQGFYQLMNQLPWERLAIGIGALGHMDFALAQTLEYVKERKAFGKTIFEFQNTRIKLAEQKTKLEVTRAFIHRCIERQRDGVPVPYTHLTLPTKRIV